MGTTRECRDLLISSRARSSPIRSRLRRLRKLLPSTLPSTDRSRPTLLELMSVLMSTSKLLPRLRLDPVLLHLHLCKKQMEMTAADSEQMDFAYGLLSFLKINIRTSCLS